MESEPTWGGYQLLNKEELLALPRGTIFKLHGSGGAKGNTHHHDDGIYKVKGLKYTSVFGQTLMVEDINRHFRVQFQGIGAPYNIAFPAKHFKCVECGAIFYEVDYLCQECLNAN